METLIVHFMKEYELTRGEAEDLLNESLSDFEVMRSILQAAYMRRAGYEALC